MSIRCVTYQDLLFYLKKRSPFRSQGKKIFHTIKGKPTGSYALAQADYEEEGAAQNEHDAEVVNLSQNSSASLSLPMLVCVQLLSIRASQQNQLDQGSVTIRVLLILVFAHRPCSRWTPALEGIGSYLIFLMQAQTSQTHVMF